MVKEYKIDIAVLQLIEPFVLSSWLFPACLDLYTSHETMLLKSIAYGKVAGFSRTALENSSATLQALNVSYISFYQCLATSKNTKTELFLLGHKFCARFTNGS